MISNELRLEHFDHAHKTRHVKISPMMRAFNPHNAGGVDGKPSKLELMRADYQRKLMKEKEEKMIQMYEDNQRKVMSRMGRGGGAGEGRITQNGAQNGANGTGSGKSVRDFFNERRRMEAKEISSTAHSYRQTKELPSPTEWPSRVDSSNTPKKSKASAGRDRSQPLAPIRRPHVEPQETGNPVKSGIPQKFPVPPTENREGNPFPVRARLVKHKPLPPAGNHHFDNKYNGGAGDFNSTQPASTGHKPLTRKPPQVTQNKLEKLQKDNSLLSRAPEKLTDFQKWQAEQSQAREERLKKVNSLRHANNGNGGVWKNSDDESLDDNEDVKGEGLDSGRGNNLDEKMKAKEKELLEKIAKRQRELEEIKNEREVQDEEEQENIERKKTKKVTERSKQRKVYDERHKEEQKRFKQEENETRLEIQQAEQHRLEEEKEWKENEKRIKEEDKRKLQPDNSKSRRQNEVAAQQREKLSSKSGNRSNSRSLLEEDSPQPTAKPSRSTPKVSKNPQPSRSKTESNDLDERRLSLSDAHVYEQAAASADAQGFVADLAMCTICGRSFVQERLKKHQEACAKAHKPRKEFDSAKKRVEGTDLAKYAGKAKRREPPKKKSNWRAKHEEFIQTLRHAKKVTLCEKEGGDLRNLTPPPASVNPDYVQCPHCGRSFNETAAERHIPRCQTLKTRPPPVKGKRR
ncbi:unnamed protein product [Candidula unifasciata]|uniref:C2HC/C3H-type domain-containing protein n=1 Tax=Candidula unifasciata TaxID=100452 RepID=A0A8S4A0P0_9EUPU|nr:unnamed protein product [Candidula unifasciata]